MFIQEVLSALAFAAAFAALALAAAVVTTAVAAAAAVAVAVVAAAADRDDRRRRDHDLLGDHRANLGLDVLLSFLLGHFGVILGLLFGDGGVFRHGLHALLLHWHAFDVVDLTRPLHRLAAGDVDRASLRLLLVLGVVNIAG